MMTKLFTILLFAAYMIDCAYAHSHRIEVHGHRGARGVRPENSLAAFDYAISVGVDVIELDVFVTADNQLVVTHDPFISIELCTDQKKIKIQNKIPIRSLSAKDVQTYRCGELKDVRFPLQKLSHQKIPTLAEVFEFVKTSKHPAAHIIKFNIELKTVPPLPQLTPTAKEFAALVASEIEKHDLVNRVIIQSFDYRTLLEIKKINSKYKTSQLISSTYLDFPELAKRVNAFAISPDYGSIDKAAVDALRKAGVKTIPWTANAAEQWDFLVGIGVDGIITDYPKELIEYLKLKKLR